MLQLGRAGWTLASPKDIPKQHNGCDCGVFMLKYANWLVRLWGLLAGGDSFPEAWGAALCSPRTFPVAVSWHDGGAEPPSPAVAQCTVGLLAG